MRVIRDEFLSEEDLDLRNLTTEELDDYWMLWLHQAQITNELDENLYSHGVLDRVPDEALDQKQGEGETTPVCRERTTSRALRSKARER